MFMRVILLKDIENLGKKYDVKLVKPGFGRNYLIPKKLVKLATKENLEWLEKQKQMDLGKVEQELKQFQALASKIDGQELNFAVKVGESGEIFGSINAQKIIKELEDLGFKIKKDQIELAEPIKEIGEFPIKIHFPHGLEARIQVIVTEEPKQEETEEE